MPALQLSRRLARRARSEVAKHRRAAIASVGLDMVPAQDPRVLLDGSIRLGREFADQFVLGTNPNDTRVTCFADLDEPGSLPPREFDLIVLDGSLRGATQPAIRNVLDALRPSGVLVTCPSRDQRRALGGSPVTLRTVRKHLWPIAVVQNAQPPGR